MSSSPFIVVLALLVLDGKAQPSDHDSRQTGNTWNGSSNDSDKKQSESRGARLWTLPGELKTAPRCSVKWRRRAEASGHAPAAARLNRPFRTGFRLVVRKSGQLQRVAAAAFLLCYAPPLALLLAAAAWRADAAAAATVMGLDRLLFNVVNFASPFLCRAQYPSLRIRLPGCWSGRPKRTVHLAPTVGVAAAAAASAKRE